LLAALTGVKRDITANVRGSGSFSEWHGWGVARAGGQRLAGFLLDNRAGRYRLAGQIFPRDLLTGTARQAVGEELSIWRKARSRAPISRAGCLRAGRHSRAWRRARSTWRTAAPWR